MRSIKCEETHRHMHENSKLMATKTYGALHFKRNVYLFIYTTWREEATKALAQTSADMIDYLNGIWKHLSFSSFSRPVSSPFSSLHSFICIRNDTWIFNECVNQSKLERTHTLLLCATDFLCSFFLHFMFFFAATFLFFLHLFYWWATV